MTRMAVSVVAVLATAVSGTAAQQADAPVILLQPDRVFDGTVMRAGWSVLVRGDRIIGFGAELNAPVPPDVRRIPLPGATLLPGLIDAHSHLLLHPYNETSWDDQVLLEPLSLRVARAVSHARRTLEAGFTTLRDLGTEGAGDADGGLRDAIDQGIVPGPRLRIANRAIVATGSYGPKGFDPRWQAPQGAEEADGLDGVTRTTRAQIGRGADWVKVYADYRWGPAGEARPTFTQNELERIVEVARSSGRPVVAHASTAEGMRRAVLAGVETIEHGDGGTPEVFRLMTQRGVALCPTLAAGEAVRQYRGWRKGADAEPAQITEKRASFRRALAARVTICNGSDAGVFAHGDNARELELMVEYGLPALDALKAATSVNAKLLHLDDRLGAVRVGFLADLVAVEGDPAVRISDLRKVKLVMKNGDIVRGP
jgi:imidazolonepropionase-like amidohydrolase